MKIVRIIARLNIGGPAIHISNLCDLQSKGHNTVLIYGAVSPGEGDMAYLLQNKNIKTYFIPGLGREISFFKDFSTLLKIYSIIKKEKPDIVHTHTAKAGFIGRAAAKFAGVKKIYHTFHGHVFHGYFGKLKTAFFITIEKILAHFSTNIIVLNQQQYSEISDVLKIDKKKFRIIPLGFELSSFTTVYKNQSGKKLSFSNEKQITVGIVGRLTAVKNHQLFIDCIKELKNRGINVKALIAGDGELRPEIEKSIAANGLQENIILMGWLKELAPFYEKIDYLFLTSLNEGTPVAIIEAMASGKIVISTPAGGVIDLVKHGYNGFVSRDFTMISVIECFSNVLSISDEDINKIRSKAFETSQKFSLESLLQKIDNLYKGFLAF